MNSSINSAPSNNLCIGSPHMTPTALNLMLCLNLPGEEWVCQPDPLTVETIPCGKNRQEDSSSKCRGGNQLFNVQLAQMLKT